MRSRYPSAFSTPELLMGRVSCYRIRSVRRNILVDTGDGALRLDGVAPDEVDTVLLTHLDSDHVGGNVTGVGKAIRPAFPNARYITHRADWEICAPPRFTPDQVRPLKHWGLLTIATEEMVIADGIRTISTPGHTPGHTSLWIESEGEALLLAGDAFHQPLQVPAPQYAFPLDMDRSVAEATRRRLLELLESTNAYLAASHFPAPGIGRLTRTESGLYWDPTPAFPPGVTL